MYIFSISSMYLGYLCKNNCRSAETQDREEIKLKYPGRTDGHRPCQQHASPHLPAGRCGKDGICFSAGNPVHRTPPGSLRRAGSSSFPHSTPGLTALCTLAMQNLATLMVLEDLSLPALRASQRLESL